MVLVCAVYFMMVLSSSYSDEIQTRPENEVLILGQQYVWPCQIPTSLERARIRIQWTNEKHGTNPIYPGTKVPDSLNHIFQVIEQDTPEFKRRDLKFLNVSPEENDIYHCTEGLINRRGYSANIIVTEPEFTKCDIFPMKTSEQSFVLVKEGDSFKITCNVKYHTQRNCYAEGLWHGSLNNDLENQETQFDNRSFTAILKIDENFQNGSSYKFSVKFKCLRTQKTLAEYSPKEPIFETNFVTPTFYLKETETPVHVVSTTSTTTKSVTLHYGASELNPPEKANPHDNQTSTITFVFAGILAFFAILVIVLVSIFLVKYRKRTSDDSLTMYNRGQSMMTENVAYRRQPVSCENSYNMQVNNNLTPPPQTSSMGFQGILSPHAPHSAVPLLHQGLQQYHHGASLLREVSKDDSEVYDRIDDKGVAPSIYLDSIKKQPSSSSQLPHFNQSVIGYVPMTPSRMPSGHQAPFIPSSPAFFNNDPGLYLVPQDKEIESQQQ